MIFICGRAAGKHDGEGEPPLATVSRLIHFARSANMIVFGDRRVFDAVLRQLVVVLRLKDEQFAAGLCDGSNVQVPVSPVTLISHAPLMEATAKPPV